MRTILHIIMACAVFVFIRCSNPTAGGSGTDVGNARVAVVAYRPDGTSASDALVRVRPSSFLASSPRQAEGADERFDTRTDLSGKAVLTGVDTGSYTMEIIDSVKEKGSTFAGLISFEVSAASGDKDLGRLDLEPAAGLSGYVDIGDLDTSLHVYVRIRGLDRIARTDSAGRFTFSDLPASDLQLDILAPFTFAELENDTFTTVPGTVLQSDTVRTVENILDQELEIVCQTLRGNGISGYSLDRIVEVKDGRITGLQFAALGLRSLPMTLGRLSALESLDCTENGLADLPDSLSFCRFLRRLNLSRNDFSAVPQIVWDFDSLRFLDLSYNHLSGELSPRVGNLVLLDTLYTGLNDLDSLPEELGSCSSLLVFSADENNLSELPFTIGNLRSIKKLVIGGNNLSRLPREIVNCTNLEKLFCAVNNIDSLPGTFTRLTNLKTLNFRQNQLGNLPLSSAQMESITSITVSANRLCSLPDSVSLWLDTMQPGWRMGQNCKTE
ncbi:MAG: leucine-rich repeat domain-containing protein [Chitinispirillaceae bacterium]